MTEDRKPFKVAIETRYIMSALQFSASFFSSLLGGGAVDGNAKTTATTNANVGGDPFSALLNVVGSNDEVSPTAVLSAKKPDKTAKRDNNTDPLIVPADEVIKFRESAPIEREKEVAKPDNNIEKPKLKADKIDSRPVVTVITKDKIGSDKTASDELDKLQAKITDKIDSLSGLLAIIAALLAKPDNNVVQDNLAINPASIQTGQVVTGDQPPQVALGAVFADLKNNLYKIQQFLQEVNNPSTPQTIAQVPILNEAQIAQLAQLNTALQADIATLKSVLPQNALQTSPQAGVAVKPEIKQLLSAQLAEVSPLLNSDISAIKDLLQKFKLNNKVIANVENINPVSFTKNDEKTVATVDNKLVAESSFTDIVPQPVVKADVSAVATEVTKQNAPQAVVQVASNNTQNSPIIAPNISAVIPVIESNNSGNFGQQSPNSQGGQNQQSAFNISGITTANNQQVNNASATRFSSLLNPANQANVAEQVVFHVKTAVATGDSKIHIQLHPDDLGKLDITLDVSANGKTGVTITADNKQTLDLLQKDSSGLAKALADAGLKTDAGSLSFNLRGGEQQGQGQSQFQAASTYRSSQPEEDILPTLAVVTRSYVVNVPDGLDISI